MRFSIIFITIFSIGFLFGCDKDEDELNSNIEVEEYVELLLAEEYKSQNLPEFTYDDIPALLQYRNTTQKITNFPHNPISSLFEPECTLGMYILWTIESIRAVAIDSEYLIDRFPSQNPILALRNTEELELITSVDAQMKVAKAYYNWWESNKINDFSSFKQEDPLVTTQYQWH